MLQTREKDPGGDEGEPDLLIRARGGDQEAIATLYRRHRPTLFRYVYRRAGDWHVAEDIVSEAFLRALSHLEGFRWQRRSLDAWLTTIAGNILTDQRRSARFRREVPVRQLPEPRDGLAGSPEEQVIEALERRRLHDAVAALGAQRRTVISLRYWREMPGRQVAARMGRSLGTVKSLQHRATRDLRAALSDQETREEGRR